MQLKECMKLECKVGVKMENNIDKKKCNAWCELLLAIMKLTKELNKNEKRYIMANFTIALASLELEELQEKSGGKNV